MILPPTQRFGASMKRFDGVKGGVYHLVQTMDQFWEFHRELKRQSVIAIDTETSGFDWNRTHVCGIVVGWGAEFNFYLPVAHQCGELQLSLDAIREPLREVFEDPDVAKVFWNEKFDRHFLRSAGLEVRGVRHDGVVLTHLLDENAEKALKKMSQKHISRAADKWEKDVAEWRTNEAKRRRKKFGQMVKDALALRRQELEERLEKETPFLKFSGLTKAQITAKLKKMLVDEMQSHPLARNKKDDVSYDYIPLDIITPYACADVHYTLLLYKQLVLQVAGHDDLRRLYVNEMQLSDLLFEVEHRGIKIDVPYLNELEPKFRKEIADLEQEIYQEVGHEFNLGSNQQLVEALLKAGVRLTKLTNKGKEQVQNKLPLEPKHYCVDNETLTYLAVQFDFAKKIQDYRKKCKLLNTYVVKIRDMVDEDWFLHSTFNANVTTGRMSSREPNVQNIPARQLDIRRAFTIPERRGFEHNDPLADEWVYVSIDYSQVELRLTAHHSKDYTLLDAYPFNGPAKDVHSITCAEAVMGITLDEFMAVYGDENNPLFKDYKWFRNLAKRVNFGIIYGAGAAAIQRQVSSPERHVSREECQDYISKYFMKYPGVKEWIDRTTRTLSRDGYLQNSFGRFRRLPDSQSHENWKRERAGRQGVNFLIQGDAADLFKHAAVKVDKFLQEQNAKTSIVNFVHDEIQFYWHKDELNLIHPVKTVMEDFPEFEVPIRVDIEVSPRDWAAGKEI